MNENLPSEPFSVTLHYYEQHAEEFAQRTQDIDLSPLYEVFLPLLPSGGLILDAGCGTGRDSAAFIQRGFRVMAFDASKAMVDIASKRIGQPVLHISFDQLRFDHEFDAVWAAASLLHLPKNAMEQVFQDLHDALVPQGILYASFKHGNVEEFREGRFFNDYDEQRLSEFMRKQGCWTILKLWRTGDIGQQRADVEWVNLLARAV
jgi:SAM-dependent methyltransferase